MSSENNIHPIHDRTLPKSEKEALLGQKGGVFWLTGLSGSGKSTLAIQVERLLHDQGRFCKLLDGDNIRNAINGDLGFSMEDRRENIRRVAEIARLFKDSGVITVCTFICPTIEIRAMARKIVGEADFHEVYVHASLDTCESRDPKGLYKKARAGQIPDFTGIHSPYEAPPEAALTVDTGALSVQDASKELFDFILQNSRR